jgi:hypothetical protein
LFAHLPRDDSSSGTITPFGDLHEDPESSVAEELGLLELETASDAPKGMIEPSPLAVTKAGKEGALLLGSNKAPLPQPEIDPELSSAGNATVSRNADRLEDLPRLPVANSAGASRNPSVADGPLTEGEAPLNPETTRLKSIPGPQDTDPTREVPLSHSIKTTSDDGTSFITVDSQPDRDYPSGDLLDRTPGMQVSPVVVEEGEGHRTPKNIPKLESVRTGIEIPPAHAKDKIPKIYVQNPSDATETDVPLSTRRASAFREHPTKGPRSLQSITGTATIRKSSTSRRPSGLIDPEAAKTVATKDPEPRTPPLRKRKLYLRKARNLAARKVILNITLGRELAKQTKPALRRLAKGEYVVFEDSSSRVSHGD